MEDLENINNPGEKEAHYIKPIVQSVKIIMISLCLWLWEINE